MDIYEILKLYSVLLVGGVMENVICTVVKENTAEEFISVLNKYGVCTDYSNDYERSKAIQGIFVVITFLQ